MDERCAVQHGGWHGADYGLCARRFAERVGFHLEPRPMPMPSAVGVVGAVAAGFAALIGGAVADASR